MSGVRCFAGVALSTELETALARSCAALREGDPAWRDEKWVSPQNLHLTVKFFGDLPEAEVRPLCDALGTALPALAPFDLPVIGLRASGGLRRCRMLWGVLGDPEGACEGLHAAIEDAAVRFGVEPDTRAFAPHVTLCRARRPKRLAPTALTAAEAVLAEGPDSMSVVSLSVFTSRLTPRGPIYSEIGSWRLGGE